MSSASTAARVALPVPLDEALWYEVPKPLSLLLRPGQRVRVPLGKVKRIGVVTELASSAPAGIRLRPIEDLLDLDPVVAPDLLTLAQWIAEYYLAPIGEVIDALLPSDLPGSARVKVSMTSAGALAPSLEPSERTFLALLIELGPTTLLDLAFAYAKDFANDVSGGPRGGESGGNETGSGERSASGVPDTELTSTLTRLTSELAARGLVRLEGGSARSSRFKAAVELMPKPPDELSKLCGRSAKAQAIVDLLRDEARPMTVSEVIDEVECGRSVVRRLVKVGVLREFTQVNALELDRHVGGSSRNSAFELRPDQSEACDRLVEAISSQSYGAFLLRGMTGSGKTEVYLRGIERALEIGKSSLILVPEIAMVPSLAATLKDRFEGRVALLHSNLSKSERSQEWQRIKSGAASVVVGPRSAALAPIPNLGLVVVDEEHDASYKQDQKSPHYSGRDVAMVRARRHNAVAVIASATPSMEALGMVEMGKARSLELTERVGNAELPTGVVVDLRQEPIQPRQGDVHFSSTLDSAIRETAAAGQQIILLRNRRGFSPVVLCRACGEDHRCDDCGLPRTLHWKSRALICHYCASKIAVPQRCHKCNERALEPIGAGTERVEGMFRERYPNLSVDVLDRDATQRVGGAAKILEKFRLQETQVLIGTQMVSKGHHFPNVALTGVLSADTYLNFPDFRAVERTFSLLTQVVGRAGRGDIPGRYVLQTFHPDHYAIRAVLENDSPGFERDEMEFRRKFGYPPYSRVVSILLRDEDQARGSQRINAIAERINSERRGELESSVRMTGPASAPLERLRGKWRFQILLRGRSQRMMRELLQVAGVFDLKWDIVVDVDPQNLM